MEKIFILGSCVSRDAFALEENSQYNIVSYLARTSFGSGFHHKKTEGLDLSPIQSAFQRRMVENDILKQTVHQLTHCEFDWLVVDLIDERFNLFLSETDEVFTLSPELENNCQYNKQGKILVSGSDDFLKKWKSGWDNFIALAKQHGFLHKIVLNKVFWTNQTDTGGKVVDDAYLSWINENNAWLAKLYAHIELVGGIKTLEYPPNLLIADSEHQWGLSPYHYSKPLYLHLLAYLGRLKQYWEDYSQNGIIHTDCLPLVLDDCPIKRKSSSTGTYHPWVFQGSATQDSVVDIVITFASDKATGGKDLLHTLCYQPEQADSYTAQGYARSASAAIGNFKYIMTEPFAVYERQIRLLVPKNTQAEFSVQEFYPKGKTVVLGATIKQVKQ